MADPIPVAEYQKWIAPNVALDQLKPAPRITAIDAIRGRIRSGGLRACAYHISQDNGPGTPLSQTDSYCLLEPGNWIDHAKDLFWSFGDVTIQGFEPARSILEETMVRHGPSTKFEGVRLDPVGLSQLAAQLNQAPTIVHGGVRRIDHFAEPREAAQTGTLDAAMQAYEARRKEISDGKATWQNAAPSPDESAEIEKKPISDATLKAWWDLCKTIRPSEQWTNDQIRAYFDQCFLDKAVSRDRLRGLRENAKSGPKAKSAE